MRALDLGCFAWLGRKAISLSSYLPCTPPQNPRPKSTTLPNLWVLPGRMTTTGTRYPDELAWIKNKNRRKNGNLKVGAKMSDEVIPACPRCDSQEIWKSGLNSAGNQQWRCRSCDRVYVSEPYLRKDIVCIADRMLEQKIPVPQIAEVLFGFVSRRWLYMRKGAQQ